MLLYCCLRRTSQLALILLGCQSHNVFFSFNTTLGGRFSTFLSKGPIVNTVVPDSGIGGDATALCVIRRCTDLKWLGFGFLKINYQVSTR